MCERILKSKKRYICLVNLQQIENWSWFSRSRIVGLAFYDDTLTGVQYIKLLRRIIEEVLDNFYFDERQHVVFKQDGTQPHNSEVFPRRHIATHGPILWPARSQDIAPLDFCFWGYLKDEIYWKISDIDRHKILKDKYLYELKAILSERVMSFSI